MKALYLCDYALNTRTAALLEQPLLRITFALSSFQ